MGTLVLTIGTAPTHPSSGMQPGGLTDTIRRLYRHDGAGRVASVCEPTSGRLDASLRAVAE